MGLAAGQRGRGGEVDFSSQPEIKLELIQGIVDIQIQFQWYFVRTKAIQFTIVFHGKPVIQQETMVAFLSIRIIYLRPRLDGLQTIMKG